MTAPAPDWRAIRDRVMEIANNAQRLAEELPDPLTEAFAAGMAEVAAESEATARLIQEIDPAGDPEFDAAAALAEIWRLAGAAALAQVAGIAPMMTTAFESLATHAAPTSVN